MSRTAWVPWPDGPGDRCTPLPGRPDVVVHRATATASDPDATAVLDDAERSRLERLRRPEDRARFATARLVARTALGERLGLAPQDVPLVVRPTVGADAAQRDGTGRPAVEGDPLVLSIAHAGDVVLVAIAGAGSTVGVDVEGGPGAAPATDDLWSLAATPTEQAELRDLTGARRDDAFLALWTRKEAVLKACGRGLTVPMTALAVSLGDPARLRSADPPVPGPERTTLADLDVGPGRRAALAVVDG